MKLIVLLPKLNLLYYRLREEAKTKKEWKIAQRLFPGNIEVDSWLLEMERKKP
jgi:hypothetical protein